MQEHPIRERDKSKEHDQTRMRYGHLLHLAQHTRLRNICHVDKDVIGRMTVERSTQTLLVKVVSDKADATSEDEEAVQCTDLQSLLSV